MEKLTTQLITKGRRFKILPRNQLIFAGSILLGSRLARGERKGRVEDRRTALILVLPPIGVFVSDQCAFHVRHDDELSHEGGLARADGDLQILWWWATRIPQALFAQRE